MSGTQPCAPSTGARPRRVAIPDEAYRIAELSIEGSPTNPRVLIKSDSKPGDHRQHVLHQPADPGRRDRCTEPPMLSWSDVAVAASDDSSCSTIEAPTPLDPAQKGTAENE